MNFEALGKNIKKYRVMLGFSQAELAEKCGCCNSHIGQIENAKGIPSLEMTIRIAEALSVTVDQLLKESYANPERAYLREAAERIEKYSVGQRIRACEGLLAYLDSLENFNQ